MVFVWFTVPIINCFEKDIDTLFMPLAKTWPNLSNAKHVLSLFLYFYIHDADLANEDIVVKINSWSAKKQYVLDNDQLEGEIRFVHRLLSIIRCIDTIECIKAIY